MIFLVRVAAVDGHAQRLGDLHSFRGSTYMSERYGVTCARLGLRRSASRTGSCLDNAVAKASSPASKPTRPPALHQPCAGPWSGLRLDQLLQPPAHPLLVRAPPPRRVRPDPDDPRRAARLTPGRIAPVSGSMGEVPTPGIACWDAPVRAEVTRRIGRAYIDPKRWRCSFIRHRHLCPRRAVTRPLPLPVRSV